MPLADRALGNLQQWLIGTYHGVSRTQLAASNRRPHSKPCSVSELAANQQSINAYEGQGT